MSNQQSVKLIGSRNSAYSVRVQIALDMKGVQYEYQKEDITNKSPELLRCNPVHQKIPVLVHSGKAISESHVILEYIDETWEDNPILPKDPYQRAMARFLAKFIDDKCHISIIKAYTGTTEERESATEEAEQNLKVLEKELEGKKFFGGESIGFVDICACVYARWLPTLAEVAGKKLISEENFPNLCRWQAEYASCDIIKENLPDKEELTSLTRKWLGAA